MSTSFSKVACTLFLLLTVLSAYVQSQPGNPVVYWNTVALNSIKTDSSIFFNALKNLVVLHNAIYDALADLGCYKKNVDSDCNTANVKMATAYASIWILKTAFPNQYVALDEIARSVTRAEPSAQAKAKGRKVGIKAAQKALLEKINDGLQDFKDYEPNGNELRWKPTPPFFQNATLPNHANQATLVVPSQDMFPVGPPPAATSARWIADYNEVKSLGQADSTTRTQDQTDIARFWAAGPGTSTPVGLFSRALTYLINANNIDAAKSATMYKLLLTVISDGDILNWNQKYIYDTVRPITVIRSGLSVNPSLSTDPNWNSLLITPPFPEYTSGHSTASAAWGRLMNHMFGTDTATFTIFSDIPAASRTYTSFSAPATEAQRSRVYGGIHFQFANDAANSQGIAVADYIFDCLCPNRECLEGNRDREISPHGRDCKGSGKYEI